MKQNEYTITNIKTADEKSIIELLSSFNDDDFDFAKNLATKVNSYGNKVFMRVLIEFSNYCKNNCRYCGLQAINTNLCRYRMTKDEVLDVIDYVVKQGFKSIVLQSGEDISYTDDDITYIIKNAKEKYVGIAITLSIGEKTYEQYKKYKDAGADRYLLRHETIDKKHYETLHPIVMSYENRINCLHDLRKLSYQVGTGFMVGSPKQSFENLAHDLIFIRNFKPEMIGIGPFIPHESTEYKNEKSGSVRLTLFLLSLLRIMFPSALIPSTTALSLKSKNGFIDGLLCGANVIMLNMTPKKYRENYLIYDNKDKVNDAESTIQKLQKDLKNINRVMCFTRGDYINA